MHASFAIAAIVATASARRDGQGASRRRKHHRNHLQRQGTGLRFEFVAVAEREGMIARGDGSLHLLPKGQAALIRMLHPEDGYHAQHGDAVTAADRKFSRIPKLAFNDCESPLARLYAQDVEGRRQVPFRRTIRRRREAARRLRKGTVAAADFTELGSSDIGVGQVGYPDGLVRFRHRRPAPGKQGCCRARARSLRCRTRYLLLSERF